MTKLKNKTILTIILGMFLLVALPLVSAEKISYSNEDLDVTLSEGAFFNLFKGEEIGKLELKSHKSIVEKRDVVVNEINWSGKVNEGAIGMFYDFNFSEIYKNGLGEVEFTDMKTGKLVKRDYRFVYLEEEEYEVPIYSCNTLTSKNGTSWEECFETGETQKKTRQFWKPYNSKDIPKGKIRIGIEVEVRQGDWVDGVFVIGGKRIKKHASWEGDTIQLDSTSSSSTTGTSLTFSHTTSGDNRILFVGAQIESGSDLITGVTYAGTPMTLVDKEVNSAPNEWIYLFSLTAPDTGANDIIISSSSSVAIDGIGISYTGVSQTGQPDANTTNNNDGATSINTTLNTVEDNSGQISVVAKDSGTTSAGEGVTQREVINNFLAGDSNASISPGGFPYSMEWTGTSGRFITIQASFSPVEKLSVSLTSPENNEKLTTNNVEFELNIVSSDTSIGVENATIEVDYANGTSVFTETNTSGLLGNYNFTKTVSDGDYNWTSYAYGNDSIRYNASETRSFSVDSTIPQISLISPNETFNYLKPNDALNLIGFANDTNLDTVWYNYNNTNTTISGATTETLFNESLSQGEFNQLSITVYANDTFGNLNSQEVSWNFNAFENNIIFTDSTFETASETFTANITSGNSAPSLASLFYNGTEYSSSTITNTFGNTYNITRTIDIPLGVQNNDFYFNFTLDGTVYQTTNNSQEVNLTFFTPTNATFSETFLNISFKDENDLTNINASVPTSSFVYYLGSGLVNKTLVFVNNTDNFYYDFSGTTGSEDLKVVPEFQYRRVNDYPQRIWQPGIKTYNSTQTDQTLYLLNTNDGIFVTYQVLTGGESPIEGVSVVATRVVSGETVQIGAGETDSAGLITFWMNPDFQHTVTFTKTGFDTFVFTHFPTQNAYTITLGTETEVDADCIQGITQTIRPTKDFLWQNEVYNFNYSINSAYWNLTSFQFTLLDGNGLSLGSNSSTTSSGGTLTLNSINLTTNENITMNYLYNLDPDEDEGVCGQVSGTRVWLVQTQVGTEFSIWNLGQQFNSYVSAGFWGIDDFGKTTISFIIIVVMVGGLSRRYGIASEGAIMGILFGIVFLLDVGFDMIPQINIGSITVPDNFLTMLVFLILLSILIREESR